VNNKIKEGIEWSIDGVAREELKVIERSIDGVAREELKVLNGWLHGPGDRERVTCPKRGGQEGSAVHCPIVELGYPFVKVFFMVVLWLVQGMENCQ